MNHEPTDDARYPDDAGVPDPNHPQPIPTPPEVMEWVRQQFTEEEIVAGLREVEKTGGFELRDFLPDLERDAGSD